MFHNAAFSSWSACQDAEWRRGGGTSMWYHWIGASTLPGPTSRSILVEDGAADVVGIGAADVVGVLSGVSVIAADAGGVGTRIDGS